MNNPLGLTTSVVKKVALEVTLKELSVMEKCDVKLITPGGQSTAHKCASRHSDSGESATSRKDESERLGTSNKIKYRNTNYLATFNANSLLKVGKLKTLTDTLKEHRIIITAVQETRFMDEDTFESGGFRILKGKTGTRVMKNMPHLGTGFVIDKKVLDSIISFESTSERLCTLTFKSTNKVYTIVNAHAPINIDNKKKKEKVQLFWDKLDDTIQKIPEKHCVILLGDFNAQVGREKRFRHVVGNYPAHNRTNQNGIRLIELCQAHNLVLKSTSFKKLPRKQKTWMSPNPLLGEFQLDHVAIKRKFHKEIQNVRVLRGANLDSDHYLSKVKLKIIPKSNFQRKNLTRRRYDPEKIKEKKEEWGKLTSDLVDQDWKQMEKTLINKAEMLAPATRTKKHRWWNDECDKLLELRKKAWHSWKSKKDERSWQHFVETRKMVSKKIKKVKKEHEDQLLRKINDDFAKNNMRNYYRIFREKLNGYEAPTLQLQDKNGNLAYSNKDNCKILADYFKELLNCEEPQQKMAFNGGLKSLPNPDSKPPSISEIQEIVAHMENFKASGENQITAELWKYASKNAIVSLQKIFEEIWKEGVFPEEWKMALIHPLHKKGSKSDPNNYRGISLVDVTYKILSRALLKRAEPQLDCQIGEYQAGFRKGRSCPEQILNLRNILAYQKQRAKPYIVTFVDFQKAYDSIDRESLFYILEEFGLDGKTLNIIKETLTNTPSKVRFMGELSEPFEIRTGVRQGDGLSPLLFNCALEKVVREWDAKTRGGIRLGTKNKGITIKCLAFADDLALLAETWGEAKEQIAELQEQAGKIGLKISFDKTKIMTNIVDSPTRFKVGTQKIEVVRSFKYLGEWIEWNNLEGKAMEARRTKMELAFQKTKNTYNKKTLSWNSKIRHYNTVIKPEALYAAETLVMGRKGQMEKLEIKERKILRKIMGPKFQNNKQVFYSNEALYLKSERLSDTMRKRRIDFYGHILRMDPGRLTKQIFDFFHQKKTKPNWFKEVEKDLKELQITEVMLRNGTAKTMTKDKTKRFQDRINTRKPYLISEEERKKRSDRMKNYWEKRRAQASKK